MSFQQEYLNIWLSESEGGIFSFSDFEECQTLQDAFIPRTPYEIISGVEQEYDFEKEDEVRTLVVDIAISGAKENDNSIINFTAYNYNTNKRKHECWLSAYGANTLEQVLTLKRAFYEYKAKYIAIDVQNAGRSIVDLLATETVDEELGITYPAWDVVKNPKLRLVTDNVYNDIVERMSAWTQGGEEVLIPISGNANFNTSMHLSVRKNLKNKNSELLIDDTNKKIWYEDNDINWLRVSAEEKTRKLLPFLQTKFMINEAISLDTVFTETGNIKLKEHSRIDTKDRYVVFGYCSVLCDALYELYNVSEEEYDDSDWSWMGKSYI